MVRSETEARLRKTTAFEIVRPLETETVHQHLAVVACLDAQPATRRNWLVEHRADRCIHRAHEELQILTAVHLQTSHVKYYEKCVAKPSRSVAPQRILIKYTQLLITAVHTSPAPIVNVVKSPQ